MSKLPAPRSDVLLKTIQACVENGARLLEETFDLEFRNPPSSRLFLILIAQEEFAKAFILYLVKEGVIPFTSAVLRAINDHICKQLIGMMMDYMIMHWENLEELQILIETDFNLDGILPNNVGSAIDLLRYEKIGRWEADNWVWAEDPNYEASALHIFEGKKERHKQDALYVRVARDGQTSSVPKIIEEGETCDELAHAQRYKNFINNLLAEKKQNSYRYDKAMTALKLLFGDRK